MQIYLNRSVKTNEKKATPLMQKTKNDINFEVKKP